MLVIEACLHNTLYTYVRDLFVVKYIRHIDGFWGMYRGLGARICYDFVYSAASAKVAVVRLK